MNFKTALAASTFISTQVSAVDWNQFSSSLLIEVKRNDQVFTSSAVAIKRNVILTAAHSVDAIDEGYIHLASEYSAHNPKIKFKKVIIHHQYDQGHSNYKNDIAVVILETNLPDEIKPIKLADTLMSDSNVSRIGFGGRNGQNIRTWTNPQIMGKDESTLFLTDYLSVVGDSGGPIYQNDELIGIHSTLEGANKTYAVYVPNYLGWINEQLPLKEVNF